MYRRSSKKGFIQHPVCRRCSRNKLHNGKLGAGFTLIELIIYVAIMAATLIVVIDAILGFAHLYRSISASQVLARSGSYAMERMVRDIRNAQSIDQTGSVLGAHPGRLTVVAPAPTGTGTSTSFFIATSTLQVSRDGVAIGGLTSSDVVVDNLVFYRMVSSSSEAVRIVMTLSKLVGTSTVSATFYDSAVLRGSYPL